MSTVQYPQKQEIKGPWLLSEDNLEALDGIILEIDVLLKQSWKVNSYQRLILLNRSEEEVELYIESRRSSVYGNRSELKCVVISKNDVTLSDKSIKSLLKDPALEKIKLYEKVYSTYFQLTKYGKFDNYSASQW